MRTDSFARHGLLFRHRCILIEWMSDVCFDFQFTRNTFFRSVALLDMYLSAVKISPTVDQLQHIATLCMMSSNLAVENRPAKTSDFSVATANTYSPQFLNDELPKFLNVIGWNVSSFPTFWNYVCEQPCIHGAECKSGVACEERAWVANAAALFLAQRVWVQSSWPNLLRLSRESYKSDATLQIVAQGAHPILGWSEETRVALHTKVSFPKING